MNDPEIGGFEGFYLPEPIATWYQSFYDDYMAYLKVADRGASGPASGTLLGAEAPPGLLAIEDVKPDEYYQAANQIRGALDHLPEQLQQNMEPQLAEWVHSTVDYAEKLWLSCEYAKKACERTSARIDVGLTSTST